MEWLFVIAICAAGIIMLDDKKETVTINGKTYEKYSYEYCRENLSANHYDNWHCQGVAQQLKDNWIKDELEYLMRNGYSFERAVDYLINDGTMKL